MKKLWKNRPALIALIAAGLFLLLSALTVSQREASQAENLFYQAVSPIQEGVNSLTEAVTDFFTRVFFPSALQQKNETLKEELAVSQRKNLLYEETLRENARLSELLDFVGENSSFKYLTASVTAKSLDPYVDTVTINAGSRSGVTEKMAVITAQGIVGRVVEVGATWSKVRTMQNEDMRISVLVERTRDEGMLGGLVLSSGDLVGLKLYYLPKNADIQVGDRIVTSGLGGIFPKGLYVGTVMSLTDDSNGEYDACVGFEVDYEHLEEVLVILEGE